jgi:hypothetical protein
MQGRPVRRGEFGKTTFIHLRGPRRESESESRALESRPFLERVWTRSELFGRETPRLLLELLLLALDLLASHAESTAAVTLCAELPAPDPT